MELIGIFTPYLFESKVCLKSDRLNGALLRKLILAILFSFLCHNLSILEFEYKIIIRVCKSAA